MAALITGVVALALIYMALNAFRNANPQYLVRLAKIAGGIFALAFAAFIGARGELAVAIPVAIFGAGLLGWSPFGASLGNAFRGWGRPAVRSDGQKSQIRTEFIELTFDLHTGAVDGRLMSGAETGRVLSDFTLAELLALARAFDDPSRALLESYLDRRFPGWREDAQDATAGWGRGEARRATSSGKMTAEEAYQILGLQRGAGRDEISRAHRGLMKKLHPDQGGSTYLAARVNEAKDTLLRTHQR
ncbi:MAG: DnaJ domain-containing protein [Xanthobacteraceae bacterium]|nr:DnaJ domain-containing protein [Xanthobacteraceae bacterium]